MFGVFFFIGGFGCVMEFVVVGEDIFDVFVCGEFVWLVGLVGC